MVRSTDLTTTSVTFSTVFLVRTAHLNKRMVYNVCIMHPMGGTPLVKVQRIGGIYSAQRVYIYIYRLVCGVPSKASRSPSYSKCLNF